MDPIKITQLPAIGNNIQSNTVLPVVEMSVTPVTKKATVANVANFVLQQAGNLFTSAGLANMANFAGEAGSVSNASQPNITSVGILSNLTVEGQVNLGNVSNLIIYGGNANFVLTTDGNGVISWQQANSLVVYGNSNVANFLPTYTGNLSGDYLTLTHDVTANVVIANYLYGDGSNITNLPVSPYSNSNVASYLPTYTGNISANSIDITNQIQINTGGNIYENGNALIIRTEPTHIFEIWGNDGASDYKWIFEANGRFTFPSNDAFLIGGANVLQGFCNNATQSGFSIFEDFEISATDNVQLFTDNGNTPFVWTFDKQGNLEVPGSILPNANISYDLGNNTNRFKDIYLANSTIYLGDATLSANGNSIVVDSISVTNGNIGTIGNVSSINLDGSGSNVLYGNGVFAPASGGNANIGDFVFANTTMSTPNEDIMLIQTTDNNGNLRTQMRFDPNSGIARMLARNAEQNSTYTTWTSATYTGTEINVVDAPDLINFLNTGAFSYGVNKTFTVNGGNRLPYDGYSAGGNNATIYTSVTADPDPTTVTSMEFFWQLESKFEIDYDDGSMNINSTGMSIYLDNDQTQGPDIWLRSGDDITLQGKDKTVGSESEGGDINIYAGDGAGDDGVGNNSSSGGDIQIYAGVGGYGNSSTGSEGGTARLRGGTGGDAGVSSAAGQGGFVEISAGAGGYNNGNIQLGAQGGHVDIYAGQTTLANTVGGNVSIRSGEGGDNAIAGNVQIITPSSGPGGGGTWTFDGNGLLELPGGDVIIGLQYGSQAILASNTSFGVATQGANVTTFMNWSDDVSNTSVMAAVYVNAPNANPGDIHIRTGDVGNANIWQFNVDGNLVLPNGNSVIYSIANSSLDPTLPNVSTMTLTPDSNYGSQVLVLDPTAPGHIHLRAYASSNIDEPSANIFLGGENTSFEVTQGANNDARIHSGGNTWYFENNGNLVTPGLTGTYIKSAPGGYMGLAAINDGGDQPAQLVSFDSNLGLGTTAISAYANDALIQTNIAGNTMQTWVFSNTGNLTLPGNTFSINFANGSQASVPLVDITDTNGLTTVYHPTFVENRTNGQIVRADVDLSYRTDTNTLTVGNITGNTNGFTLGYLNIPQVSASNTTLELGDAGKHYYSTTAGNLTLTVPNNATTSFATGTAISIVVQAAGNVLVNAASGVTLYMAGSSTAGNRVVGSYGMATLMKVASDTWFINGTGVY